MCYIDPCTVAPFFGVLMVFIVTIESGLTGSDVAKKSEPVDETAVATIDTLLNYCGSILSIEMSYV